MEGVIKKMSEGTGSRKFNKIEKIRHLRNKIHIQGLEDLDRSYRRHELEFIGSVMNELLSKV